MTIQEQAHAMKLAAPAFAAAGSQARSRALAAVKEALLSQKEQIFAANAADLQRAEEQQISPQVRKRLLFNEAKLADVTGGIEQLIALPDPDGRVLLHRELDEGLILRRVSCPIGVIGVIFEARPDALVQISSLCLKSGNCAVLKGGKETRETNRVLFDIIHQAVIDAGLPAECLFLAEQHSEIDELLSCEGDVDLLIPRGSNKFVRYIMEHTKIPVMGHADGICHIYVDKDADQNLALPLITDAKTQYPVACNAVETVLVHRAIAGEFFPRLKAALDKAGVKIRGTEEVQALIDCEALPDNAFHTEYGDLILSAALVDDAAAAVRHINTYGSHHTDCIITDNDETAAFFEQQTDSAGVYRNCSTRFADGFRYGFGAEVGISTSKLHARGPVGLEGLMTYKYILEGKGQIVGDYASGKSSFHFKDLL